jgi:hypothetical protein
MPRFTPFTEALLTKAGWTENREVDIAEYEQLLLDRGAVINETIRHFLKEFAGLRVVHPHGKVPDMEDYFVIGDTGTVSSLWADEIQNYIDEFGVSCYPVGEACRRYITLFMDELGRVFGEYAGEIFFYGSSPEEAIENLCRGQTIAFPQDVIDKWEQELATNNGGIDQTL